MIVRMKATGQVEDFDDNFARHALACGMAEVVPGKTKEQLAVRTEAAVIEPVAERAALLPTFRRAPMGGRGLR